jgi:hypothetical protein
MIGIRFSAANQLLLKQSRYVRRVPPIVAGILATPQTRFLHSFSLSAGPERPNSGFRQVGLTPTIRLGSGDIQV